VRRIELKKRKPTFIVAVLCLLSLMGAASAESVQPFEDVSVMTSVSPQAEQREWHYRILNGQMQKRLWSITENMWLTDWINVSL
jgi:hypothetical protein